MFVGMWLQERGHKAAVFLLPGLGSVHSQNAFDINKMFFYINERLNKATASALNT